MEQPPRPAPRPAPRLPKKSAAGPTSASCEYIITHVSPSSVTNKQQEQILLVFNQALPDNVEFTVFFSGLQSNNQSRAPATKIGANVLSLKAPDHYPPEDTKLTVHHGNHATKLSSYVRPFSFQSHLQKIKDALFKVSDPIEFMSASLHLRQKNSVALDFELEKQFKKNVPPHFNLLAEDGRERLDEVETFSSTPTLLHFAAQYNLLRLSIALLECPGGRNALNTANEDGYTPSDLAHSYGHENLAAVLADAQQNPNRVVEEIYETMQDPTYQAYRNNLDDSDDMYIAMGCAEEEEIYTEMTGRGCGDVEEEEEEDIYENTTAFGQDSYSGYRADQSLRSLTKSEKNLEYDRRSMHSMSSTSSAESAYSSGSGSDVFSTRPKLPEPRRSLNCIEVTGKYDLLKSRNSLPHLNSSRTGSRTQNEYATRDCMTLPRRQGDVPPVPPPKNPNVNQ